MTWFNEDVWKEWERMHEEMNNWFDRLFRIRTPLLGFERGKDLVKLGQGFRMPICQIHQTPSSVVATFEMPGVEKNDIELNVSDNSIEVKVEKKEEKKLKKKDKYSYISEQRQYYRKVSLPVEVKPEKATAEYKNGILKVEVPKKKVSEAKTKKVAVK